MSLAFLHKDFLLDTPSSRRLFHEVADHLPIVDFHNHLDPAAIADNRFWSSIGENWLEGDHYKWRVMRWNGIAEDFVTGTASDREKYDAFARTVPHCVGNPIYHWTHLELSRYFGWNGVFGPDTADEVWDLCAEKLAQPSHSARGLLEQMNVAYLGTTDDPCDDLSNHKMVQNDGTTGLNVSPSFRPDKAYSVWEPGFADYCQQLATVSGVAINRFADLIEALLKRLDHFISLGCKASDHGLNELLPFSQRTPKDLDVILHIAMDGDAVSRQDQSDFKAAILLELGQAYAERNIVMQYHIGVLRNQNSILFDQRGRDVGGDSISDACIGAPLNNLLDLINRSKGLPRTILYCLNPALNETMVTIAGNFQDGSEPGKIQSGPAWWYNDQLDGMERHLTQVAQMGLLSRFIGMLTDSRSFLSFPPPRILPKARLPDDRALG